ncbi:MAG: metal-dependent transcriptional regulator [Candidatus Krumholzibacteria bacterium]|nr:metal-dependent transcriptional regulator [Candidatus Krumholzibacteria bacterium]MDH4338630.1 metal-dependent transcriptional regulator [Candidatus Krumholzibacteria bacterium]MDH5271312.1 metal-dependent transcriptional regulator [Candidatus Krumholzibacteria bacterium]
MTKSTPAASATARLTQSMENYLKAIFEIAEHAERASTSSIAERMGIAPASVTAMVKKLAELNLVTHEPYQGVQLTPVGEVAAVEVVRHHRLIEKYLAEALGVPWDQVHDEAEKLEHVISEDLEDRIATALGDPTVDPHGAPIPSRDGAIARVAARRLCDVPARTRVVVLEVDDRDSALLRYLGQRGLYPGTGVEVLHVEPYGGSLTLRVGDGEFSIGREAAAEIRVST